MISVDVIMLSNSGNSELYKMTTEALDSLKASELDYNFDVKLVESSDTAKDNGFIYPETFTIVPYEPFHYNKFLNYALKFCSHEWLAVVNNDVVFYPGWFSAMMSYHENNPLVKSFSPIDPLYEEQLRKNYPGEKGLEGYEIRKHIKGWCIVSHKELVKTCELFDETFSFWYQDDDDYIETIKRKKYKHALILDSFVHHFGSKSTELFKENTQQKTWDQAHVFNSKWGQL